MFIKRIYVSGLSWYSEAGWLGLGSDNSARVDTILTVTPFGRMGVRFVFD